MIRRVDTATARVDQSLVVSYGARANEDGVRSLVQNMATLAAVTVSPSDPNAADLSAALNQRLTGDLARSDQASPTSRPILPTRRTR